MDYLPYFLVEFMAFGGHKCGFKFNPVFRCRDPSERNSGMVLKHMSGSSNVTFCLASAIRFGLFQMFYGQYRGQESNATVLKRNWKYPRTISLSSCYELFGWLLLLRDSNTRRRSLVMDHAPLHAAVHESDKHPDFVYLYTIPCLC